MSNLSFTFFGDSENLANVVQNVWPNATRSGSARGNRCRPRWTSRFPDPEGRESAIPFPCWLPLHLALCRWGRLPIPSRHVRATLPARTRRADLCRVEFEVQGLSALVCLFRD